jgi:hypothetical protein
MPRASLVGLRSGEPFVEQEQVRPSSRRFWSISSAGRHIPPLSAKPSCSSRSAASKRTRPSPRGGATPAHQGRAQCQRPGSRRSEGDRTASPLMSRPARARTDVPGHGALAAGTLIAGTRSFSVFGKSRRWAGRGGARRSQETSPHGYHAACGRLSAARSHRFLLPARRQRFGQRAWPGGSSTAGSPWRRRHADPRFVRPSRVLDHGRRTGQCRCAFAYICCTFRRLARGAAAASILQGEGKYNTHLSLLRHGRTATSRFGRRQIHHIVPDVSSHEVHFHSGSGAGEPRDC